MGSGSLAARALLVGCLAARRFVAARVGTFPRRPLRGGLGTLGAFGAELRGGLGTLVRGTVTRGTPGSIACGRFVARPSWALLCRAIRGIGGGLGRTWRGAGRAPIGAAPPRGHALRDGRRRGGRGRGRRGCGCLPGGCRGLGALLLLAGQGLAGLAGAETARGSIGRGGGRLARRSPTGHADGALHGAGGGRGGGSRHEDAADEELKLQAGRGRARHGAQGLVGQVRGA